MTANSPTLPTKAQRELLEAVQGGADLRSDWNDWYFEGGESVNGTTAKSVHMRGWVRCFWQTGELRRFEITPSALQGNTR